YIIEEGAELELGAANEDQTATHDITVSSLILRTLSGAIVGLDDITDDEKAALTISLKKPENKLYVPEVTIDKNTMTYTALLETGAEYTIITEGINDYELDNTANNNSDRIKINSDTIGRNITYKMKPVYAVTIEPNGASLNDLAEARFEFTNINEKGYVYTFTGTDNIKLRDGTYSVVVSNSGDYRQKMTSNFTVNGSDAVLKIAFDSTEVTKWDFTDTSNYIPHEDGSVTGQSGNYLKNPCGGLSYTGTGTWQYHGSSYGSQLSNIVISVPVSGSGKVNVDVGYTWNISSGDVVANATSGNNGTDTIVIPYENVNKVDITVGSATTYIKTIEVVEEIEYKEELKVGAKADGTVETGYDFATINEALALAEKMKIPTGKSVTITIKPGNYEEMLVIKTPNIKLVNEAGENASIGLRNKGVDIDPNAVRITSYYGVGYNYYSMDSNYKWDEELLEFNKGNGSASTENPAGGGTGSFWNATVVIDASNVSAEGIIFENSFNQYISKKAAEDVLVKQSGAKEGAVARASMAVGDTTVQQKDYVERAAALAISNNRKQVSFDNCKFIGRQDTLYGGKGTTASFYNCSIYGATDYIMGYMTAVFAKCDLVFNTNDQTDAGVKNDVGYITAAQQDGARGYLMYNCHVTSTIPGVDTASQYTSKPGYFGRPWTAKTGEALFYKTIVDETDARWQNPAGARTSLIVPVGWSSTLSGESEKSQELGTYEVSGVDNSSKRASWSRVPEESSVTVAAFLGTWNPFDGKDMTIVLPNDENIAKPAAPTAIVTPEPTKKGEGEAAVEEVIKGASIVLSSETGAKVYYNVNAEDAPTKDSTPYTGAIKVDESNIKDGSITVKAIAVKYDKDSDVATFTYSVAEAPDTKAPVLPEAGDIKLGSRIKISAEAGAEIYYNVNSEDDPDNKATLYTGKDGIEITTKLVNKEDSTVTIKAIAILNDKISEVASAKYDVIVNAPTANYKNGYQFPDGGGKVELTADEGVTILYTMGSEEPKDPTADDAEPETYDEKGITVSADTIIKAVAKRGSKYSEVVTLNYIVPLSMPTADPESGSVLPTNARTVKLTADEGTTIYYTTGTDAAAVADPADEASARQTYDNESGITVTAESTVIKAVAIKGDRHSVVALFTYTLSDDEFTQIAPLTAKVNKHSVNNGDTKTVNEGTDVTVTLETTTPDVVIYYTLDGTAPTLGSNKYKAAGIVIANISKTTVIQAVATRKDMLSSDIFTVTIDVREGSHGGSGEGLEIILEEENYTYTGSAIIPDYTVTYDGEPLIPGIDYTVKVSNNVKVAEGKAKITVTGKGNLSGKTDKTFNIKQKSLAENDEEGAGEVEGDTLVVVDGAKATPVLTYNGKKLAANKDFEFAVSGNKSKKWSTADNETKVTINGKGSFKDSRELNVVVVSKDAQKNVKLVVKLDNTANKNIIYDGTEKKPTFTSIENKGKTKTLEEGVDYIVSYPSDIISAGKKTFTVTGISADCVGTVTKTYTIKPAAKDETKVKVALEGTEVSESNTKLKFVSTGVTFAKDALEVTYDGNKLDQGVDYKITYSANKKVGTAKYTVTGLGNYKGVKKTGQFKIEKAAMSEENVTVIVSDVAYGKPKVYKSAPSVIEKDTNTLLKTSNYKVTYCSDEAGTKPLGKSTAAGTAYVKIEGKGGYDSATSIIMPYEIKAVGSSVKDLSTAKIVFNDAAGAAKPAKNFSYTGEPVQPYSMKITFKDKSSVEVVLDKDAKAFNSELYDKFDITFVNNTNKGKASVIVKADDDSYVGGKTATFSIAARNLKNFTWGSGSASSFFFDLFK
ncbi:MAG: hypothetical protein HDR29_05755, partial [Lachnospiraceae bacterium]|nr:hypothetical protein [Lachnospiraceae bacterium]